MKNRIKRVPILRNGHVVGIVSRADIVRALTRPIDPVLP
jgi:CBS domain-containing protein